MGVQQQQPRMSAKRVDLCGFGQQHRVVCLATVFRASVRVTSPNS
jgi:hypothetical protein